MVVVESAFGFYATGQVFGSGASAFGHHHPPITRHDNGVVSRQP
jgi:hypothetical protein